MQAKNMSIDHLTGENNELNKFRARAKEELSRARNRLNHMRISGKRSPSSSSPAMRANQKPKVIIRDSSSRPTATEFR